MAEDAYSIPSEGFCDRCEAHHDWMADEHMNCIPPVKVRQFDRHVLSKAYRAALYGKCFFYTTEEVVGSYLGHNPHFPSQAEWDELPADKRDEAMKWDEAVEAYEKHSALRKQGKDAEREIFRKATEMLVEITKKIEKDCPGEYDSFLGDPRDLLSELYSSDLFKRFRDRKLGVVASTCITTKTRHDMAEVDIIYGLSTKVFPLSEGVFVGGDIDKMRWGSLEGYIEKCKGNPRCFMLTDYFAKNLQTSDECRMIYIKFSPGKVRDSLDEPNKKQPRQDN